MLLVLVWVSRTALLGAAGNDKDLLLSLELILALDLLLELGFLLMLVILW